MSLVKLPGLGLFKGSAGSGMDIVVGAGAGLVGIGIVKYAVNQYLANNSLPGQAYVMRVLPALAGIATGAALYAVQKGSQKSKGHAIGAILAGAAINIWDEVRAQFPNLSDLVSVRLSNYGYGGMLVDDTSGSRLNGMIINDQSAANLAELNAINMNGDDEDD